MSRETAQLIDVLICTALGMGIAWYTGSPLLGLVAAIVAVILPEWLWPPPH